MGGSGIMGGIGDGARLLLAPLGSDMMEDVTAAGPDLMAGEGSMPFGSFSMPPASSMCRFNGGGRCAGIADRGMTAEYGGRSKILARPVGGVDTVRGDPDRGGISVRALRASAPRPS